MHPCLVVNSPATHSPPTGESGPGCMRRERLTYHRRSIAVRAARAAFGCDSSVRPSLQRHVSQLCGRTKPDVRSLLQHSTPPVMSGSVHSSHSLCLALPTVVGAAEARGAATASWGCQVASGALVAFSNNIIVCVVAQDCTAPLDPNARLASASFSCWIPHSGIPLRTCMSTAL